MTAIPELRNVDPRPFWQATMPDPPDRRGRDLPDAVDVVVVGGGLMGLSAARRAAELGASVVLLEAERIGWGASTRNGGFCHPGFKQSLTALRQLYGVERAEALYRETIEAFDHVERLCTSSIDAEFERTGHLVLASAPSHAAAFDGAVDAMRGVGMEAHVVPRSELRTEIGSDAYFGGLVVEQSAGLNPARLTLGLADLAEAAGRGPARGDPRDPDPAPGRWPVRRRDLARRRHRDQRDRRDQRLHGRPDPLAAAPDHGDQQLHHRRPSRCRRTSPRRSAPIAGCSSTPRTSSTTGG